MFEKIEINFRDKKLNMLEAKTMRAGMYVGIISLKLNEDEQREYKIYKEFNEKIGELVKVKTNYSEKIYFIKKLDLAIHIGKIKYCKENGHISRPQYIINGTKSFDICKRCRRGYTRSLK